MTLEELLMGLRDIAPPPDPAWWLLAPAQLVALGLLIVLVTAYLLILRHRRVNRLGRLAEMELRRISSAYRQHDDARQLALELSKWIRRVAMLAFPAQQPQGLSGRPWLEFLDWSLGDNRFSGGSGKVFGSEIYSENISVDGHQLVALCGQWLSIIKPRLTRSGLL